MHWFLKFISGIKLYMFQTVPVSIIRSFSLYTQQWYMSYRFADSLRAGSFLLKTNKTLHVSDSSSVHHQEFYAVHTAMVYVIQVLLISCKHDQFLQRRIKLYMFRTVPLSIIRSITLYTQQWYMSYRFTDSLRAGSCSQAVSKPVRHIPFVCTAKKSWWSTE